MQAQIRAPWNGRRRCGWHNCLLLFHFHFFADPGGCSGGLCSSSLVPSPFRQHRRSSRGECFVPTINHQGKTTWLLDQCLSTLTQMRWNQTFNNTGLHSRKVFEMFPAPQPFWLRATNKEPSITQCVPLFKWFRPWTWPRRFKRTHPWFVLLRLCSLSHVPTSF